MQGKCTDSESDTCYMKMIQSLHLNNIITLLFFNKFNTVSNFYVDGILEKYGGGRGHALRRSFHAP